MATKGSSKLYTISNLWSGLEDIRDQVNRQSIRLFRLLQVDSSDLLSPLVLELLKYYNCDLNTFIFNGHSFAITLEDILYITGLPIQGIPIMDASKDNNAFSIFDTKICRSSYPVSKLKDRAKDTRVDPITRMKAALLVLIACFVIPTGDNHRINRNFVKYVDKLDEVDNYAWGAALLAFLHDGIIKWKKEGNQKSLINGNLWVVLSVFLIRIRSLREAIHIKLDLENAEVPLLHSVVNAVKNISHNHKPKYLDKVKEALDTLSEEEINWVPYKHLQLRLPGILKEQETYKLLLSPICCMDSIVHHRPHLAAKQFEELKHLDLSKLTWQKTDLVSKQNRGLFAQKLSTIELAQWNAGKLVTDFLPGYEEEGLSRHNEETSISRDADASRKMSLDTNMEIIHSPLQNGANEATSQPSDAAFAYENVHHSIPEESRIKFYKRCRGSNVVEKEKKNMPVVDNKEKKCGKKKKIMSSKENEVAQEAMRQADEIIDSDVEDSEA
ncbi:hypothetical protein P8452_25504 [Trifolium repens]|nr:hypothetical protein P8452_25504 [Trifolium repens]